MGSEIEDFCAEQYRTAFEDEFQKTRGTVEEKSRAAQKVAINSTVLAAMEKYPNTSMNELWDAIKISYIVHKSSFDVDTIRIIESTTQSWKSSSGKAFEDLVSSLITEELSEYSIIAVVQTDMKRLIDSDLILNDFDDINWFLDCIDNDDYDCYVLHKDSDKYTCFGVLQCKTTLRDRVTRDREPSITAMEKHNLWSTIFILNGEHLIGKRSPSEFEYMVEGGGKKFPGVGFHSLYCFSNEDNLGQYKGRTKSRLFFENLCLTDFKKHAILAYKMYRNQRHKFNRNWHPDDPITYRESTTAGWFDVDQNEMNRS